MRGLEAAYEGEEYEEERKRASKPRGFDWIGARDVSHGTSIRTRIIAHSELCPQGYHRYSVHRVYAKSTDLEPIKVLCTESHSEAKMGPDGRLLKRDCFMCDLYAWLKREGLLDKIFSQDATLGKHVQEACSIYKARTTLFPVVMQAIRVKMPSSDPDKEAYELRPDPTQYNTFVFAVKESDGTKNNPLITQFANMARANPNLANPMTGSWFQIGREPRSDAHAGLMEPPGMLVVPNLETILKTYPKIRTWGQTDNRSKPGSNIKRSYSFMKSLVRDSWMGEELTRYGVVYADFEEAPTSALMF